MKYKVLDSSGLAFNRNFNGLELEYLGIESRTDQIILKQPPVDINGNKCIGVVIMDRTSVKLVIETN